MPRTVILEHTSPDGDTHFDWLIAPDDAPRGADVRDLIHFRMNDRPDALALEAVLPAQRGPDHRRHYLDHEGPLEGDKGAVKRVGEGTAEIEEDEDGRLIVRARFKERAVIIEARAEEAGGAQWILQRTR